jgi:hypothetical protein
MSYEISGSSVMAKCEVKDLEPVTLQVLHIWAVNLIRGTIDVIGFSKGMGIGLILDRCKLPGSQPQGVGFKDDGLASLCTISMEELIRLTNNERGILKQLHDLVDSLLNPLDAPVNLARAIEGFAKLLSAEPDKAKRWKEVQSKLNLSKDYLAFITGASAEKRHGSTEPHNLKQIVEARKRAWTIAGRFLEFRKRGNASLPLLEFPLL